MSDADEAYRRSVWELLSSVLGDDPAQWRGADAFNAVLFKTVQTCQRERASGDSAMLALIATMEALGTHPTLQALSPDPGSGPILRWLEPGALPDDAQRMVDSATTMTFHFIAEQEEYNEKGLLNELADLGLVHETSDEDGAYALYVVCGGDRRFYDDGGATLRAIAQRHGFTYDGWETGFLPLQEGGDGD